MKQSHFQFFVCLMLLTVFVGCELLESECGSKRSEYFDAYGSYFKKPADIYWGVTSGVRSYTYNYEFGNICTKQNPKVSFTLNLNDSNAGSANPISVNAGVGCGCQQFLQPCKGLMNRKRMVKVSRL